MNAKTQWLRDFNQRFLSVGIVSADWSALTTSLAPLDARKDWLHIDIMDGSFCPGFTMGPWCIKHLPKGYVIDVHLMTEKPIDYAIQCAELGAHIISFQYEACTHIHHVLKILNNKTVTFNNNQTPVLRGLSLCPSTPISVLAPIIHEVDMVQLLAVDPGYGTKLSENILLQKISDFKKLIHEKNVDILLSIDGSLDVSLAKKVISAGADVIVSGSAIFKSGKTSENLIQWHSLL